MKLDLTLAATALLASGVNALNLKAERPDVCARYERTPSRQSSVETKLDEEPVRILETCCAGLEREQQLDKLKSLANSYRSTLTSTRTATVLQNSTDLVHSHTRQQHRAHDDTMHKPSHEVR